MENFDSQDKTCSMIEKITFSASEKGVGKKLMFQSWRCGVSTGFGKRIMCRRSFSNKNNYLYCCLFMSHAPHLHAVHIGIHIYTLTKNRDIQALWFTTYPSIHIFSLLLLLSTQANSSFKINQTQS